MRSPCILTFLSGLLLMCTACGSGSDGEVDPLVTYDRYGQPFEPAPALPVHSVLAEPDRHAGGPVMVEGVLRDECDADDCWMTMRADTARLLIRPPGFQIAGDIAGRRAVVHGHMTPDSSAYALEPTGVMVEKVRSRPSQAQTFTN